MNCMDCGSRTEVVKTMAVDSVTQRLRQCPCGSRFLTAERLSRILPPVTGSPPVPPATARQRTGDTGNPPATAPQPRAYISPSDLSGLSLSPSKPQSQTRVEPHSAFLIEWNLTAKTGSRDKAVKAWEKLGRPAFGLAWKAWERSEAWSPAWFNFPHVVTWLNDGRWRQDPSEARVKNGSTLPPKVEQSRATAIAWAHKVPA